MKSLFENIEKILEEYSYEKFDTNGLVFKKLFKVSVKRFLFKESFFVAFVDCEYSERTIQQVNDDFEKFMICSKIDCSSLLCIFKVQGNIPYNYSYFFSNKFLSFVHPLLVSESNLNIYFDSDFHYQGDKELKRFVKKIKTIKIQADG